jgi:high affinity sulfate transporter 1
VEEVTHQTEPSSRLARILPILGWLPGYSSARLRYDLVAGATTAAVVVPQSMAYATIAGLPVEVGLYTALVPMLVYALLGTSRVLSVSVTSTLSMLTAAQLALVVQSGDPGDYVAAASTLALLAGAFLVLAALLRLGFIANFISIPVLTGFKAGIGLVIFVGQLGKVLGISVPKGPFFQTILAVVQNLGAVHWPTFLVALVTLAILIGLPRLVPRLSAPLVAVVVGIAASALLGLDGRGVKLVGDIPPGLPPLALPDLSLVRHLWPGALGIALMSFTESIASARAFVHHGDPPVNANQELLALGAANLAGSFFRAYPSGGGASQTTVNQRAGARTQVAGIVTAGGVALTLLFLGPLIGLMPQATLGALVLIAAAGLINLGDFRAIARVRWEELGWAAVALVGVVVLGTLQGILVAVAVSMLTLLYHANHPPVYALGRKPGTDVFRPLGDHPGDEVLPGLLMVRVEGRLHFASAPRTGDTLRALIQKALPRVLVLDLGAVPDIEYTALNMLTDFEDKLREQGITLWLSALNPVPLRIVEHAPLGATLGQERIFYHLELAFEAYRAEEKQENSS